MTPTRRFVGRIVVRQRSVAGRSVNARCSVQQQRRQQLKYAAGGAVYGVCSTSPGKAPSSGADKQWRRRFTGFRSCCLTSLVWRDVRRSSSNRQLCCCCCCWRFTVRHQHLVNCATAALYYPFIYYCLHARTFYGSVVKYHYVAPNI